VEGSDIKKSRSWLSFQYKCIRLYIFHRNERYDIVDEFASEKLDESYDIIVCGDSNISRPGYIEFRNYMEKCGMKKMDIEYLYNSSEIDQNHNRRYNMEIYYKSSNFILQCIMDKDMILNESSHIIVPFKIIDMINLFDTHEAEQQMIEINQKILADYSEKIYDTISQEKHEYDRHIKCMSGKSNDPVFDNLVIQMYISCDVSHLETITKVKHIVDSGQITRHYNKLYHKMMHSMNTFQSLHKKCLMYYKSQALVANNMELHGYVMICFDHVNSIIELTDCLMSRLKYLNQCTRNKKTTKNCEIKCGLVYDEIESELAIINAKYDKIEKFIKQKCIESTYTPDEHLASYTLDNASGKIINTMSELTTLQTNIASIEANVEHIESHSKDNDRSKKIVKKALRNKGTQTFIKEKKIINDNETKIKQIIDAL